MQARQQRGAVTIFISMIILLLMTVLVLTAYTLSTTNLRAVGNVQARNEAISAANMQIEAAIQSEFWNTSTAITYLVDLNLDGVDDYSVLMQVPRCVRANQAAGSTSSSVTLPGMTTNDFWQTIWELDATATNSATGAEVQITQGVRVLLSTVLKDTYCT